MRCECSALVHNSMQYHARCTPALCTTLLLYSIPTSRLNI
jgi:hypothetical protein